jgi:hypothetical protein
MNNYEVQFLVTLSIEAEDEQLAKRAAWRELHALEDVEDHCQLLEVSLQEEEVDDEEV